MIKNISIFDLDGTIIDSSHRQMVKPDGTLDLAKWFEMATPEMIFDDKVLPLAQQVRKRQKAGDYVLVCTARNMTFADFEFLQIEGICPDKIISRHPFPGPGLAIRILGDISEEKINILQKADFIYINELKKNDLYDKIWQAFCVLLPVKTVGVMGDERTYEYVLSIRAVTSIDGMTADIYYFDTKFLAELAGKIISEVRGINRVTYDVTSKPPGTIEWE